MKKRMSTKSFVEVLDFLAEEDSAAVDADPTVARWATEQTALRLKENNELRRGRTPAALPVRRARPIRDATVAMPRAALVMGVVGFMSSTKVMYVFRSLKGLTDNDLRRLYDVLDPDNRSK